MGACTRQTGDRLPSVRGPDTKSDKAPDPAPDQAPDPASDPASDGGPIIVGPVHVADSVADSVANDSDSSANSGAESISHELGSDSSANNGAEYISHELSSDRRTDDSTNLRSDRGTDDGTDIDGADSITGFVVSNRITDDSPERSSNKLGAVRGSNGGTDVVCAVRGSELLTDQVADPSPTHVDGFGCQLDGDGLRQVVALSGPATLVNFSFVNGASSEGGSVHFDASGALVACQFKNSHSTNEGGAVWFAAAGSASQCTFENTSSTAGGALHFQGSGTVDTCAFTELSATDRGGALSMTSGHAQISSSTFEACSSTKGGSIFIGNAVTAFTLDNVHQVGNVSGSGGAFFFQGTGASVEMTNVYAGAGATLFVGNPAPEVQWCMHTFPATTHARATVCVASKGNKCQPDCVSGTALGELLCQETSCAFDFYSADTAESGVGELAAAELGTLAAEHNCADATCPPGRYVHQSNDSIWVCVNCTQSGAYCPEPSAGERKCPHGFYCPDTKTKTPCANDGSLCRGDAFRATPVKCPAGFFCANPLNAPVPCVDNGLMYCPNGSISQMLCPAGSRCQSHGSVKVACPHGKYRSDLSVASCSPFAVCPPGTEQIKSGSASNNRECGRCPPGTFSADNNTLLCDTCGAGKRVNSMRTGCLNCPGGQYSLGKAVNCTGCGPGQYTGLASQNCQDCPNGKFSNASNAASCISCMALSTFQDEWGRTKCKQCDVCAPGAYALKPCTPSMQLTCLACGVGMYTNVTSGASSCTSCDEGLTYQRRTGQANCTACTRCAPGRFEVVPCTVATDRLCSDCAAGFFSMTHDALSCTACDLGNTYQNQVGQVECKTAALCVPGEVRVGLPSRQRNNECSACVAGTYANMSNAISCIACDLGKTYQDQTGQVGCKNAILCDPGKVRVGSPSRQRNNECTACVAGTYSNVSNALTCVACDLGETYQDQAGQVGCKTATLCVPGEVRVGSPLLQRNNKCSACAAGTFSNVTNAVNCIACDLGETYQDQAGQVGCKTATLCVPGKVRVGSPLLQRNNKCSACAAGTFSNVTNAVNCIACDLGETYQDQGGQVGCKHATLCVPGEVRVGSPLLQRNNECSACVAGTFSNVSNALSCIACDLGKTYQEQTAQAGCKTATLCVPGEFRVGSPSLERNNECSACVAGTYSDTAGATKCTSCNVTRFEFQATTGKTNCSPCTACGPGTFQLFGCTASSDSTCADCAAGQYSARSMQTVCKVCIINETRFEFQATTGKNNCSTCTACGPGRFQVVGCTTSSDSTCADCAAGQYSNLTMQTVCKVCDVTRFEFQATMGNTHCATCTTCGPGRFQVVGCTVSSDSSCADCAVGQYSDLTMQTVCKMCNVTRFEFQATMGGTNCATCTLCAPGKFVLSACHLTADAVCATCESGSFCNGTSASSCDEGFFGCGGGAQVQSRCPVGHRCRDTTDSVATPCSTGWYQPATTQSVCLACLSGTFTNTTGSTACMPCPVGRFQSLLQSETCTPCSSGSYQPETRQSVCLACLSGTFTNTTGSTACAACPVGHYQSLLQKSACTLCGSGQYQPLVGGTDCHKCEGDGAAASENRAACDACEDNFYYVRKQGHLRECFPCPVGAVCCEKWGLFALHGYWKPPRASPVESFFAEKIVECPVSDACMSNTHVEHGCELAFCRAEHESELAELAFCHADTAHASRNASGCTNLAPGGHCRWYDDNPDACGRFDTIGLNASAACCACRKDVGSPRGSVCADGHTGPACAVCRPGFAPKPSGMCFECSEQASGDGSRALAIKLGLLGAVSLFTIAGLVGAEVRGLKKEHVRDVEEVRGTSRSVTDQIRVMLPYMQRIGALDVAMPKIMYPPAARAVLDAFAAFLADIVSVLTMFSPCDFHLDFDMAMAVAFALIPWLAGILIMAYGTLLLVMRSKQGYKRGWRKAVTRARLTGVLYLACKLLHPFIAQKSIQAFFCEPLGAKQYLVEKRSVECNPANATYLRIVAGSLTGFFLLVVGIPAGLLWAVVRDRKHLREDSRHQQEAHSEMSSVHGLFHAEVAAERAVRRVRVLHHEAQRSTHATMHVALMSFTSGLKPRFFYLFVVEMFLSFVMIAFVGPVLGTNFVEAQISLSIVMAVVQLLIPAVLQPYEDPSDTKSAIIGGITYGVMELSVLTKYFAETSKRQNQAEKQEKLMHIDMMLSFVFVASAACVLLATLRKAGEMMVLQRFGDCRLCTRNTNKSRVVPVPSSVSIAVTGGKGSVGDAGGGKAIMPTVDGEPGKAREGIFTDLPRVLTRLPRTILARLPEDKLEAYIAAFGRLHLLQSEAIIISVQALARGKSARSQMSHQREEQTRAESRRSEAIHAAWGSAGEEKSMQGPSVSVRARCRTHTKGETAHVLALLRKAAESGTGGNAAVAPEEEQATLAAVREELRTYDAQALAELLVQVAREDQVILGAEISKEKQLTRQLSNMRTRLVDKHLIKAADEKQARQIMADDAKQLAQHRKQLQRERHISKSTSIRRHKNRRFKRVLAAFGDALAAGPNGNGRCSSKTVASLDANGDGVIEFDELWGFLQSLTLASGHAMSEADARRILAEFDRDQDGALSSAELLGGMTQVRENDARRTAMQRETINVRRLSTIVDAFDVEEGGGERGGL